jgi:hypothetical protein
MRLIPLLLIITALAGCNEVRVINPTSPSGSSNNSGTVNGQKSVIEFRVSGTATTATIRHINSMDGLTQITTNLPFSTRVETNLSSIFVSLEASTGTTTISTFLSVQIFVDGFLFRESSVTSFSPVLSVSGTYRR